MSAGNNNADINTYIKSECKQLLSHMLSLLLLVHYSCTWAFLCSVTQMLVTLRCGALYHPALCFRSLGHNISLVSQTALLWALFPIPVHRCYHRPWSDNSTEHYLLLLFLRNQSILCDKFVERFCPLSLETISNHFMSVNQSKFSNILTSHLAHLGSTRNQPRVCYECVHIKEDCSASECSLENSLPTKTLVYLHWH